VAVVVVVIESLLFHVACALSIDAAFMQALGVEHAHVAGLSLGAATAIWLAATYPKRVAEPTARVRPFSGRPAAHRRSAFVEPQGRMATPVEDEMLYGALIT
jgi:pimeloyl-ACP methyl ester carboxylesterase